MHDASRDVNGPGQVEKRLQRLPANLPDGIGLSPHFLAMGQEAGFDMSSPEGVAAWSSEFKRRVTAGESLDFTIPKSAPSRRRSDPASGRNGRDRSST